jgi:hypothetical protein
MNSPSNTTERLAIARLGTQTDEEITDVIAFLQTLTDADVRNAAQAGGVGASSSALRRR